ncbi:MAG: hypothetical protein LBJ01_05840, partial [Tannerella sp.]|nr:hypothetical protein [Tannerella sp.]
MPLFRKGGVVYNVPEESVSYFKSVFADAEAVERIPAAPAAPEPPESAPSQPESAPSPEALRLLRSPFLFAKTAELNRPHAAAADPDRRLLENLTPPGSATFSDAAAWAQEQTARDPAFRAGRRAEDFTARMNAFTGTPGSPPYPPSTESLTRPFVPPAPTRVSNSDYSKQELTPEAIRYLEDLRETIKVRRPTAATVSPGLAGEYYEEKGKIPEEARRSVQDFLANTKEGQEIYKRHTAFIDTATGQLDELEKLNQKRTGEVREKYRDYENRDLYRFTASPSGFPGMSDIAAGIPSDTEMRPLAQEAEFIKQARNALKSYQDRGETGAFGQFLREAGRGFGPMVEDVASFGMSGLFSSADLKKVVDRAEKEGYEKLTDDEKRMFTSWSLSHAIQGYFAPYRTVPQEVAAGIEHSIPYMTSFV